MIHVAVGILYKCDRVLVSWEEHNKDIDNCWVFPGGKVKAGESPEQALRREWYEELGVEIEPTIPLICLEHDYADMRVQLDVRELNLIKGKPYACEGQFLRWFPIKDLEPSVFPDANRGILTALKLPSRYAILPEFFGDDAYEQLEKSVKLMLNMDVQLILLRSIVIKQDYALAEKMASLIHDHGADCMLHSCKDWDCTEWIQDLQVAGIHFSQAKMEQINRRPVSDDVYFSVSCHSLEEIKKAQVCGADFCCLSTPHKGQTLDLSVFEEIVSCTKIPVFALGNMQLDDVHSVREHGGQGIAGIRCFSAT